MTRIGGTAALIAGILALTGCTQQGMPDSDYYDFVRGQDGLEWMADQDIENIGRDICDALKSGDDMYAEVVETLTAGPYTAEEAGALIGTSVAQYCPGQKI